jgi:hypothetical protein
MNHQSTRPVNHEKFIEVWNMLHLNTRMFDYWVKHGDFSILERRLLKASSFYKKNKKQECFEILMTTMKEDAFLEGFRFFLIGLLYNQHGHFFYAIENLESSIRFFEQAREQNFILTPLCVLVNVYGNRRDVKNMANCIDRIKEYRAESDAIKLQVLYAEQSYFTITNQYRKAENVFRKAEEKKLPGFEVYRPYFLVNQLMTNVKEKKYSKCYQTLHEYHQYSGCLVKANYSYMKALLDLITQDKPLYIYSKDFKDFPEMHHQLEVIKALMVGDMVKAEKFWAILSQHNPELYTSGFNFKGDQSLFYQALQKYENHINKNQISPEGIKLRSSKVEKLHYILSASNGPLSNEKLISLIWNEQTNESTLMKLRKLISNYTKKYGQKVKSYQGTYRLIRKAS